jgi:hypothetical protein
MKFSLNEHRLIHKKTEEDEAPAAGAPDEDEKKRLLQTGVFEGLGDEVRFYFDGIIRGEDFSKIYRHRTNTKNERRERKAREAGLDKQAAPVREASPLPPEQFAAAPEAPPFTPKESVRAPEELPVEEEWGKGQIVFVKRSPESGGEVEGDWFIDGVDQENGGFIVKKIGGRKIKRGMPLSVLKETKEKALSEHKTLVTPILDTKKSWNIHDRVFMERKDNSLEEDWYLEKFDVDSGNFLVRKIGDGSSKLVSLEALQKFERRALLNGMKLSSATYNPEKPPLS